MPYSSPSAASSPCCPGRTCCRRTQNSDSSVASNVSQINDLGNPKMRKTQELPAFYEVTEVARSVLDSGDELSVDLLAKLVKFQLLDIKNTDIQRRAAVQRAADSVSQVKEKSAKGSAKGEKGKNAAEVSPPQKDTKLKRRGDEDTSSYIGKSFKRLKVNGRVFCPCSVQHGVQCVHSGFLFHCSECVVFIEQMEDVCKT
ncbi:sperm-associated antigen 17-like isoform X2 [Tachysurus fulvidraco]|uniref:sperm-associated antigen 17-like isoform X2 n=1 Tax=Tachysurus fulvidraco TaxID=1234273 RepID=UPI001FEEC836|nr:sperm-associated antigen 17-like isoform X2 [Tachysurus fulvidraco]